MIPFYKILSILQAQLKPGTVEKLAKAVPGISRDDLAVMQKVPFRSYNSEILKEPLVYRLQEVSPQIVQSADVCWQGNVFLACQKTSKPRSL